MYRIDVCDVQKDKHSEKHIKRTEANPWGNGSESLIVHVFEYECFSVTVLIKPVIIMNC